jgi:hypothetical protein
VLISAQPGITQETVSARLAGRMERQKRVMGRGPGSEAGLLEPGRVRQQVPAGEMVEHPAALLAAAALSSRCGCGCSGRWTGGSTGPV